MSLDIEDAYNTNYLLLHNDPREKDQCEVVYDMIKDIVTYIKTNPSINYSDWNKYMREMKVKYHIAPSVITLNYHYRNLVYNNVIDPCILFERFNVRKEARFNSGINQITVMSSPYPNGQAFSCEHNCYFCPNEPAHEGNGYQAQPRSYLFKEPAVHRGNLNKFDAAEQMWDRMTVLSLMGNCIVDKLEVMVLGGTWGSYPIEYRIEFVRDLYYAANTFYDVERRDRYTMEQEIIINMDARSRIIGLTLETRPDHVTADEITLMRRMNCTRVQIGVQHTNDMILRKVNRGCYLVDTKRAIRNLLNVGLKVDVHIMFDLPGSSPELDREMIETIETDCDLRFDQAKFYPFQSVDWTVTKTWEDRGEYLHYDFEDLVDILIYAKEKTFPWVRLNRVIRDIPNNYILAGVDVPNLRQVLETKMCKEGKVCKCIRCREAGSNKIALERINEAEIKIREYNASDGMEYFISMETSDEKYIYGFCRLRISEEMGYVDSIEPMIRGNVSIKNKNIERINLYPYLNGLAMVRELHVYGDMVPVSDPNMVIQHRGFGKKMLKCAEEIAIKNGYSGMAIISGVGARQYYMKHGYKIKNDYMIKMWCAQFKSAFFPQEMRTFDLSQPVLYCLDKIRTCGLSATQMFNNNIMFVLIIIITLLLAILFY
jgi:ELP3 family radical SAM enzyme/protein acetyltransferase